MELENLLSKVDELRGEIDKLRPIKPEIEKRIMDKFRLDWNYHSNALEGNKLTLGETNVIIQEGLTAGGKPLKDALDIRGHNEVITYLGDFVNRKEALTEATIRGLHKMLLHESYKVEAKTPDGGTTSKWVKLGEYKTEPNFVKTPTGETRHFILPQDTPAKMHELLEWYRSQDAAKSIHPLVMATIFHHRFTQIHPFDDGNGRIGRILMNLILMQNGLLPVVFKIQNREQYLSSLAKADVGEQNELFVFSAENEIYSEELFLRGARGEDVTDFDDIDKRISLLKQELRDISKPVALSLAVEKDLLAKAVGPLLKRSINKLSQLDELFARSEVHINVTRWTAGEQLGAQAGYPISSPMPKETIVSVLAVMIQNAVLIATVNITFQWQHFQRAGLNTFGYNCSLQFQFLQYFYTFSCTDINGGILFQAKRPYGQYPKEDDIQKYVSTITERFYNFIENEVRAKK
jgi:Fic family protein